MSNRYKGGVISATPPTLVAGAGASGTWTLEQQMQANAAGLWPVNGPFYIEDVFSTYLYTGTGAAQTITNGINLSGKGGLVWLKNRSGANDHGLFDTIRGAGYRIVSNLTDAENFSLNYISSFGSTGFSLGAPSSSTNASGNNYASWTFRKQPKFFDVVTYTGTGSATTIAHSLGSVPGCIIIKRTDTTSNWVVYHRSLNTTAGGLIALNLTNGELSDANAFNSTVPTSTVFTVGSASSTNGSGGTFVAYVFAHNAGGFGLTGTDNVISCGSYTGNGAAGGQLINLGYEAQWVMIKNASSAADWWMLDTMRGWTVNGDFGSDQALFANSSAAEQGQVAGQPDAQGFRPIQDNVNQSGQTYIYIAIRRGPMKVPTSGTSVFQPTTWTGTGAALQQNVGINYDSFMQWRRNGGYSTPWMDKLRGFGYSIYTQSANAEVNQTAYIAGPKQNNYINFVDGTYNLSAEPWLNYAFVRAPSFFDEVCYTGTGSGTTITHNLGVTPELVITKSRTNGALGWVVWTTSLTNTNYWIRLDDTMAQTNSPVGYGGTFSASSYTIANTGPYDALNGSGQTFVAYLFATCAGVSKVGSYTGTATTKQIDCGFTGGARWVMIKRTDSTGDWYVWDSARGIVAGNDPYLLLNSTAAEVTNTDYVDTYNAGFEISSTAPAAINANGGTFIFLAIA